MNIHKTAIVSKKAKIGENVRIGPFSIIEENVEIGDDTEIGSNVVIDRNVKIGKRNRIYHSSVIGFPPQDVKYKDFPTEVIIGDDNVIREFTTIHRGTEEKTATIIGNKNFLMAYSHIAHNCKIGNNVTIVNGTQLAGFVEVDDYAFISGGVLIHQFVRIGKYTMIRGRARLGFDIVPFCIADGVENAEIKGLNTVGLRRNGFSDERISLLKKVYKILFRSSMNTNQAVKKIEAEFPQKNSDIEEILNFIKNSKRGIAR